VKIEDGAMIGPRCTILPGVTVGAGAVVDAGSVVNKSVPPNARVRGIPAKQVEELR
jgi:maltose O-acetyltransferase